MLGEDCERGEGKGEGFGEWLRFDMVEGETSAMGEEVFQPKKAEILFGPGDLGVLVITDWS